MSESTGVCLSYLNTLMHRIVPGGWVQGGDIIYGLGLKVEGNLFMARCLMVTLSFSLVIRYTSMCTNQCSPKLKDQMVIHKFTYTSKQNMHIYLREYVKIFDYCISV